MIKMLLVALGGMIGSVLRYSTINYFILSFGRLYPFGVLCVNVLGSFIIGVCAAYGYQHLRGSASDFLTAFVMVGIIGGFTTFSSFSLDTFTMIYEGKWVLAFVNVTANVVLCLLATALGFYVMTN
jgi:fluoride exporter